MSRLLFFSVTGLTTLPKLSLVTTVQCIERTVLLDHTICKVVKHRVEFTKLCGDHKGHF